MKGSGVTGGVFGHLQGREKEKIGTIGFLFFLFWGFQLNLFNACFPDLIFKIKQFSSKVDDDDDEEEDGLFNVYGDWEGSGARIAWRFSPRFGFGDSLEDAEISLRQEVILSQTRSKDRQDLGDANIPTGSHQYGTNIGSTASLIHSTNRKVGSPVKGATVTVSTQR